MQKNLENKIDLFTKNLSLSEDKILKLFHKYDKTIIDLQKLAQIQLNSQLLVITKKLHDWLVEINNFSFLQRNFNHLWPKLSDIIKLIDSQNLRPTIYFSISLKAYKSSVYDVFLRCISR